jgi:protein tyrosine phosphatase
MQNIQINSTEFDNKGPVVVHCSAGVGRTGTYLAIEPLMERIREKRTVNVFRRVFEIRKNRTGFVQNLVIKANKRIF